MTAPIHVFIKGSEFAINGEMVVKLEFDTGQNHPPVRVTKAGFDTSVRELN
jgi:hypothetical protein